MDYYIQILVLLLSCFLILQSDSARNELTATQFLRDSETLESSNSIFTFGFFSPINSTNRDVGTWYHNDVVHTQEVVCVANRENPLKDLSGVLKTSRDGNLQVVDGQNKSIWSSNVTAKIVVNASVVQLLDTGTL